MATTTYYRQPATMELRTSRRSAWWGVAIAIAFILAIMFSLSPRDPTPPTSTTTVNNKTQNFAPNNSVNHQIQNISPTGTSMRGSNIPDDISPADTMQRTDPNRPNRMPPPLESR